MTPMITPPNDVAPRPSSIARLACLPLLAAGLVPTPAFAQQGTPTTRPSFEAVPLDYNGDSKADLAMVRGDELWIRFDAANPNGRTATMDLGTWHEMPRMKGVDLDDDGRDDLVVGSAFANAARWIPGANTLPASAESSTASQKIPVPGGPTGLGVHVPSGPRADKPTLHLLATDHADPYLLTATWAGSPSRRNVGAVGSPLKLDRYSLGLDGAALHESLDFAVVPNRTNALGTAAWLHRAPPDADGVAPSILTWFELDPGVRGIHKATDVTLKRGQFSILPVLIPLATPAPALVIWGAGLKEFSVHPSDGSRSSVETLPFAYEHVARITESIGGTTEELLGVVPVDGASLEIYRWTRDGRLEPFQTLTTPPGQRVQSMTALAGGGIVTFLCPSDRQGGSSGETPASFAFHQQRNGRYELVYSEDLPAAPSRPAGARVVVFHEDPFTHPGAREIERFAVGDWTRDARIENGSVTVTAVTFQDPLQGLGKAVVEALRPSFSLPSTAVALANQAGADTSLFFGGSPGSPGMLSVQPRPGPGSHPRAVQVRFEGPAGLTIHSRIAGAPWQQGAGPVAILHTTDLEFYAVDSTGAAGPRQVATYHIAEPAHRPKEALRSDVDADGLDDAWERLALGGTDARPGDDLDGDGWTNAEEYQAGTDPRDALSRSTEPRKGPEVTLDFASDGSPVLRWPGTEEEHYAVETTENLSAWEPSVVPTQFMNGHHVWTDPGPYPVLRFYRVTRRN